MRLIFTRLDRLGWKRVASRACSSPLGQLDTVSLEDWNVIGVAGAKSPKLFHHRVELGLFHLNLLVQDSSRFQFLATLPDLKTEERADTQESG